MFKLSKVIAVILYAFMLQGCNFFNTIGYAFSELTVEEISTPEFYKQTVVINNSLEKIKQKSEHLLELAALNNKSMRSLYFYFGGITSNFDLDKKNGTIWWVTGGFTKNATMALMDFQEESDGKYTTIKIYAIDDNWKRKPLYIIDILK